MYCRHKADIVQSDVHPEKFIMKIEGEQDGLLLLLLNTIPKTDMNNLSDMLGTRSSQCFFSYIGFNSCNANSPLRANEWLC